MSTRSSPASSAPPERARAFAPVAPPGTRLLILGSLPGEASLRAGQYYAHPQNGFWRLIGAAIGREIAALPYPDRLAALAAAGVGLWDVVASAERPGSADAAIRDPEHADLAGLVARPAGAPGRRLQRRHRGAARPAPARRAARSASRSSTCRRRARPTRRCPSPRSARAGRGWPTFSRRQPMLDPRRRRPTLRRMALHRRSVILALLAAPLARATFAASPAASWSFPSIDGGTLDLADFRGGPVLVVNTASRCGSTPQYDGAAGAVGTLSRPRADRGRRALEELRAGARQRRGGQGLLRGELRDRLPDDRARRGDRAGGASVLRSGPPGRARRRPGTSTRSCSTARARSSPVRPLHRARRSRPRRRHRGAASSANRDAPEACRPRRMMASPRA